MENRAGKLVTRDAEVAAQALCGELRRLLAERLICFLLHGSAVMDDLAFEYSDLDFLAVTTDSLSPADCSSLKLLRQPFRAGDYGAWGGFLEGAFLPRDMLDPSRTGSAYWWGTSGERLWDRNQLGWFTLWVIRDIGLVLWGQDIRSEIPKPPEAGLALQVTEFCVSARQHAQNNSVKSVDWLLTAARLLKWVAEGVMSSKTEGANWARAHAAGSWRDSLPLAKSVRFNLQRAQAPEVQEWLKDIRTPIIQACDELEQALATRAIPRW